MKIVRDTSKEQGKWIDVRVTCGACKSLVELDSANDVYVTAQGTSVVPSHPNMLWDCPVCGAVQAVEVPMHFWNKAAQKLKEPVIPA